ncbi:tetratricopeptide repeat protein [Actinomadura atramentaria]|uniref:tetratricopeptide repeat protein n=1 Tax=Actinomadura atramentaria TaxID=1990 RepID=UPI0003797899|nr:tetratricopeptide repeat protein [Actinomadura atramentaria]
MPDDAVTGAVRPGSFWDLLAPPARQALRAIGHRSAARPGAALLRRGETAGGVGVLFAAGPRTAGAILAKEHLGSSEGRESVIELYGAGDVVGGLAPWGGPQRGTVTALDHLAVLRVDRRQFGRLLGADPHVAGALMRTLAEDRTLAGRRHALRAAEHPQRLACHLLELAERFGTGGPEEIRVPGRLSQADLADWAGLSRETLVRWFRRWRAAGVLAPRARPLTVLDLGALRAVAGPWADEPAPAPAASAPAAPPPPGLADPEPVPLEPGGPRRRLPADKPSFTGRAVSLRKLDLLVDAPDAPRAVVLQGMAGVGKSTLAIHWAHRAAGRFPDGVIFANLRGTSPSPLTPAGAMGQVLRGLGVPGDRLPRTEADLAAQCRALLAGRRALLVLDDAAGADQVAPLLAAVDAGLVVVTARRRLPDLLAGGAVRTLELREMGGDEAVALVAAVLGPGDARVRAEPRAALRLADECGRLPLALALVAARLADDPGASIAGTVRELADTAGGDGTAVLRTGLDPTFEVAYRGLRRDQRAAFRLLGLAPGPDVTATALAALTGGTVAAAEECLDGLRQTYLVQDAGPGRYGTHDLVRAFARERALAEDADSDRLAAQRRLLAALLAGARTAGAAFGRRRPRVAGGRRGGPPPDRAAALAWFEAERRTLVAAVEQAARLGLHRMCWSLADALFDFQEFRRYSEDNVAVHLAGLRAARAEEDWGAAAVMLHNLAVAHFELGRAVQAIGYAEDARRGFRSVPDAFGEAAALGALAEIHGALGRYPTAIEHARRALEIHRGLDDAAGAAAAHETLARAAVGLTEYARGERHARRALALRRELADRPGLASALLALAQIQRRRGDVREAVGYVLEVLALRQEEGDRHGTALALVELARMHAALGLRDLALRDARAALDLCRGLGARHGEARALATLGRLTCDAARFAEAFTHCGRALRLHRENGDRHGEAETLAQTGVVHWRLGRFHEAREQLERALEIRREIGDLHGEAHDLEQLSAVLRGLGRDREAFLLGLEALDLWHRLGARAGLAGTLGSLARTYLRFGLVEEAERAARQALRLRTAAGDRYGTGVSMDTFATVLRGAGRPVEALDAAREALRLLGEVGDRHGEAAALGHVALVHLDLGAADDALATGRRALALAADLGDARQQASARHVLGRACHRLGRYGDAADHLLAEIDLRRDLGDHRGQRTALLRLGEACAATGDRAGANDCARRVRAIDQWLESAGP